MNKCGSSDLHPFSDADFRKNFTNSFQLRINRLDDVNFNVFSFYRVYDNRAAVMCDSIVSNYGGYPVLHINARDPMHCCSTDREELAAKIIVFSLLGIILLSLIVFVVFRLLKLRMRKAAQKTADQRKRVGSVAEDKTSPWSADITKEGNKKPLPPAYSTIYFEPTDLPPEYTTVVSTNGDGKKRPI